MDSFKFDNVKAEKAEALRRFNGRHTFKKLLLLLCELVFAFFSVSWLSKRIPYALQISGNFVRGFVLVLDRPLFRFMLLSLLILLIFVLSSRKTSSPHIYDEYAGSCWNATGNNTAEEPVEDTVVDKQVILNDNAVLEKRAVVETVTEESEGAVSPMKQDTLSTVTDTEVTVSAVTITGTKPASGTVMVVKKDCRRSRSEMSENFRGKNRPELRRSDTTIRGQMVIAGTESRRKSMDHLSNEEFRHTIESFIAEQKKTRILENRASYLAIVSSK